MTIGTVRKFNADRGYGFITPDAGGVELFVHISNCAEDIDELAPGDRVRFDERPSARKPGSFEAFAVAILDD
jgi:CspA family cold shock protein